jgi:hypothetical protein
MKQDSAEDLTVDRWSIVPNSYVNNDGKPNLNNSNADNQNDARVAERYRVTRDLLHALEPATGHTASFAQACLDLENIRFVDKL